MSCMSHVMLCNVVHQTCDAAMMVHQTERLSFMSIPINVQVLMHRYETEMKLQVDSTEIRYRYQI